MNMQEQPQQGKWYQSRMTWVLLGFVAIGGFFLVTEHTAHFFGILPFLLLLLCPLMMLFMMHGGHGGHGGPDNHDHGQPPEGGMQ
jgi:cell division protein FtsW (lipid II flippase)